MTTTKLDVQRTLENLKGISNEYSIYQEIQSAFDTTEVRIIVEQRSELRHSDFPEAIGIIAYEDFAEAPEFYIYAEENEDGEWTVVDVHVIER